MDNSLGALEYGVGIRRELMQCNDDGSELGLLFMQEKHLELSCPYGIYVSYYAPESELMTMTALEHLDST